MVIGDNTEIGDGTCIGSFCDIGKNVVIGKKCNIQAHVTISNECKIGNNVFIGPNSSLLNDKFPKGNLTPSSIKNNVVIGGCVTILPKITVNENSVIAAGSAVTKNVPSGIVVRGVPAKRMMTREEYEKRKKRFSTRP